MDRGEIKQQIDKHNVILKNILVQLDGFYNEVDHIRSEMGKIKDELHKLTAIKKNRKLLRMVDLKKEDE